MDIYGYDTVHNNIRVVELYIDFGIVCKTNDCIETTFWGVPFKDYKIKY